ncbi:hypothetical protein [Pseudofrankia sp. EUN1h]|uniref:hypothetical protein n=2 Tax=Pseudofrankia TaxID=2994363 RepID=UPI0008D97CE2|nr:hypothetical protein [Pseudofrankia sp. EUN1h]OHV39575.1 hypothetical protein BCD49_10950 [Pseudofrankia sp. EUN1h]
MTMSPSQSQTLAISFDPFGPFKDAVSGTADSFLDSIGTAFCNMAADLSSSVFSFASQKTAVDLRADYVVENYNIVFGVAVLIVTGLFLCSCVVGAVRGDPHVFARAIASTGTAILGSFVALTLLQMVLTASDGVADAFGDGQPLGASLVGQLRALPEQGNFALDMVLSLLVALFSFALFVVLYIRKVVIIVVAVFIPIYLAGQPAMSTSAWMKRATEILVALVFAKPVIYVIFTLGAGMASDSTGSAADQTLTILSGVVVMIAAVFSPFLLLQLFAFADVQLMRAVGSAGRRGAASFGQGAGALLGSTSRDTFRGIGARLQTRNRGMLGGAGAALPAGVGGGATAGGLGRPTVRPARPGSRPGAPRPGVAAGSRVGRPAIASAAGSTGGVGAGTSAVRGRARSAAAALPPAQPRVGASRATTSATSTSHGAAARPPVTQPARTRVPGGSTRGS